MNIMGPQPLMARSGHSQGGISLARHQSPELPTCPAKRFDTAKTRSRRQLRPISGTEAPSRIGLIGYVGPA
jgi:hypothetical protein